jgi:hypothetical protein
MELCAFLGALEALTIDDVRALAIDIEGMTASIADEIDVTRAFLHIEAVLRRQHQLREACRAGHAASDAVQRVAIAAGVELPDSRVTRVARWADTIARAIVAATETELDLVVLAQGAEHVKGLAQLSAL